MSRLIRRVLIGVRRYPVRASVLVALVLMLPGLRQGEFAVDTGWYGAVALQSWRAAWHGEPGALWSLWGQGGEPSVRVGGLYYFNKPPMAFWLNGLPMLVLGPTLLAARVGSVVAALVSVAIVAALGRKLGGRSAGLACGLVLALTYEFTHFSHAFSLDMWLAAFVTGFFAIALVKARRAGEGCRWWWVWGGVLLGLALLTKPLVALAAPVILAVGLVAARWRVPVGGLIGAAVVAVLVALPWHLSMVSLHGDAFTDQYFGREVLDRAAGSKSADTPRVWFYGMNLLRQYWPWLAVLVLAAFDAVRPGGWAARRGGARIGAEPPILGTGDHATRRATVVALVWVVLWLCVLSAFPDRRARYALVVYPPAAVACGLWIARGVAWKRPGLVRRGAAVVAAGAVVVGGVLCVVPMRVHKGEPEQWTKFFEWYEREGRPMLYDGGMEGSRGARLYLRVGVWPRPMLDHAGRPIAGVEPGPGSLVMYHRRDLLPPGPREKVEFSEGDLVVTRR